jgi:hypothetical protein
LENKITNTRRNKMDREKQGTIVDFNEVVGKLKETIVEIDGDHASVYAKDRGYCVTIMIEKEEE